MGQFDAPSFLPGMLFGGLFAPKANESLPLGGNGNGYSQYLIGGEAEPNASSPVPFLLQKLAAPVLSQDPVTGTPAVPPTSLWGRLMPAIADNSSMLMAFGGGLAGARTWGEGIGRGLTQAAQTSLEQQKLEQAQRTQGLTYATLRRQDAPPQRALAAAQNPHFITFVLRHLGKTQDASSTDQ